MAYLNGEIVNNYPATKRASVNKLLTENSLTRIINRLIDSDSYVITTGMSGVDFTQDIAVTNWLDRDFEFVIHGYYFSISKGDRNSSIDNLLALIPATEVNEGKTLCARIFIDKTDPEFPELYGQDDETGLYKAVNFVFEDDPIVYPDGAVTESSDYTMYQAPLIRYQENDRGQYERIVPLDALAKFGSRSIRNIDGGEIIL